MEMFMTDLLKEAIADAKAVREVALANAKLALEEAFTPRLQSMLASKLSEESEDDGEEPEDGEKEVEEASMFTLEGDDEAPEGDEDAPADDTEVDEISFPSEGDDEAEGDEVKLPEGEGEPDGDEAPAEDEDDSMDEDLMEIIRQLEEDADTSGIGTGDNKKPSPKSNDASTVDKKEKLVQVVEGDEPDGDEAPKDDEIEEEINIREILRALREEDGEEGEKETTDADEEGMAEGKLQEAYSVIQFLREKINEVNLLNSKLLFSSKLFRSYSLTESQKMTVIENFDRANSLREVKLVYATLAESLKTVKVKQLKEGRASKPIASTRPSKTVLNEGTEMVDRMRKLANIK